MAWRRHSVRRPPGCAVLAGQQACCWRQLAAFSLPFVPPATFASHVVPFCALGLLQHAQAHPKLRPETIALAAANGDYRLFLGRSPTGLLRAQPGTRPSHIGVEALSCPSALFFLSPHSSFPQLRNPLRPPPPLPLPPFLLGSCLLSTGTSPFYPSYQNTEGNGGNVSSLLT